jgi:hypothetical protein
LSLKTIVPRPPWSEPRRIRSVINGGSAGDLRRPRRWKPWSRPLAYQHDGHEATRQNNLRRTTFRQLEPPMISISPTSTTNRSGRTDQLARLSTAVATRRGRRFAGDQPFPNMTRRVVILNNATEGPVRRVRRSGPYPVKSFHTATGRPNQNPAMLAGDRSTRQFTFLREQAGTDRSERKLGSGLSRARPVGRRMPTSPDAGSCRIPAL